MSWLHFNECTALWPKLPVSTCLVTIRTSSSSYIYFQWFHICHKILCESTFDGLKILVCIHTTASTTKVRKCMGKHIVGRWYLPDNPGRLVFIQYLTSSSATDFDWTTSYCTKWHWRKLLINRDPAETANKILIIYRFFNTDSKTMFMSYNCCFELFLYTAQGISRGC